MPLLPWEPGFRPFPGPTRTLSYLVQHLPPAPAILLPALPPNTCQALWPAPKIRASQDYPYPQAVPIPVETRIPPNQMVLLTQRRQPETGWVGLCSFLSDPKPGSQTDRGLGLGWGSCQMGAFGEILTMP